MLRIGDFSKLSKVTIKALRYYEKEGLLISNMLMFLMDIDIMRVINY